MQRLEIIIQKVRFLLMAAGFAMIPLVFWLPAHEVFEKPKTIGLMVYACLLLPFSLPLILDPFRWSPGRRKAAFFGLALLAGASLSFVNASLLLPHNRLLSVEHLAPMWACALGAVVFMLETSEVRRRALWVLLVTYIALGLYGLVQVLDQLIAQPLGGHVDLIQWTSFGVTRVYSTMGNPDYMSAQLSMLVPLLLGLGWRSWNVRGGLMVAAGLLALIPPLFLATTGLTQGLAYYHWWLAFCAVVFVAARKFSSRSCWIGILYANFILIIVAQGRGAILGFAVSLGVMLILWGLSFGWDTLKANKKFLLWHCTISLGIPFAVLIVLMGLRFINPGMALLTAKPVRSALGLADSVTARFQKMGDTTDHSWVIRNFYYRSALHMGLQHPLIGVGMGNHAMFTARSQSVLWKQWETEKNPAVNWVEPHVELYTHNDFIQNFAETGLLGLLAFLAMWTWFFYTGWRHLRRGPPAMRHIAWGLLGLGVAFTVSALINFPWRVIASQQFCWIAFALMGLLGEPDLSNGRVISARAKAGMIAAFAIAVLMAPVFVRWFPASVLIKKGDSYKSVQDYNNAIPFYEAAWRMGLSGTQRVEHHLYLGSMYNVANRRDLAEQWFKKGIDVYPDFLEARYNLGFTYMSLLEETGDQSYWQKAVDQFDSVLDVNPRYINALNNLGNMYYQKKDYDKALGYYEQLVRFKDDQWQTQYNLGAAYLMKGDVDKSRIHLLKVLDMYPGYAPAQQLYDRIKNVPAGTKLKFQ